MNVFERLKRDHAELRELFAEVEALEPGSARRQQLIERIQSALKLHAALEARYFYPLLQAHEATRELALQAMEDHELIESQLIDLQSVDSDGDEWSAMVASLRATVESHVAAEEGELFEKARRHISARKADDLGTILEEEQQAAARNERP